MNLGLCFILMAIFTEIDTESKKNRIRGIKWWSLTNAEMSNHVDPTSPMLLQESHHTLTKKQHRLLAKNPGSVSAVMYGASLAVAECRHQFANRRWDCPINESNGDTIFGKIIKIGCRETAFVYALTSAAVTYAVSRGCSDGSIYTCSCGQRVQDNHIVAQSWEWGGCSDNTKFGYKFSRDFVDVVEKGKDLRYIMNLHNNEAGRKHVIQNTREECKCHGMSGSCTVKTCWTRLAPFREVSTILKDRFDGATKVYRGNSGSGKTNRKRYLLKAILPVNPKHKSPSQTDLVYYEPSPSFCDRSTALWSTRGRQCNATSIGVDGCDLLCCGRGFRTETFWDVERCNCEFHWCCEVTCQACKVLKHKHICL